MRSCSHIDIVRNFTIDTVDIFLETIYCTSIYVTSLTLAFLAFFSVVFCPLMSFVGEIESAIKIHGE